MSFLENTFKCCKKTDVIGLLGAIGLGYIGGSSLVSRKYKRIPAKVDKPIEKISEKIEVQQPLNISLPLKLWNLLAYPLSLLPKGTYSVLLVGGATITIGSFSLYAIRRIGHFVNSIRNLVAISQNDLQKQVDQVQKDLRDIKDSQNSVIENLKKNGDISNENANKLQDLNKKQYDEYIDKFSKLVHKDDKPQNNEPQNIIQSGDETLIIPNRYRMGQSEQFQEFIVNKLNEGTKVKAENVDVANLIKESENLWKNVSKVKKLEKTEEYNILNRLLNKIGDIEKMKDRYSGLQEKIQAETKEKSDLIKIIIEFLEKYQIKRPDNLYDLDIGQLLKLSRNWCISALNSIGSYGATEIQQIPSPDHPISLDLKFNEDNFEFDDSSEDKELNETLDRIVYLLKELWEKYDSLTEKQKEELWRLEEIANNMKGAHGELIMDYHDIKKLLDDLEQLFK